MCVEFKAFFLVLTYTPNSGEDLKFAEVRKRWDKNFRSFLHKLEERKPVVWTGDLNVAHLPCDVYDGQKNKKRQQTAGFTWHEREAFDHLLNTDGFVDMYRHFHKDQTQSHYTYFAYRQSMKEKNKGWRLDYFVCSPELSAAVESVEVRREVDASDHVPLVLKFKVL